MADPPLPPGFTLDEGDDNQGLLVPGNINIHNRPVVKNADGSISTVRSISIGTDKGEVLIPTVVNGRVVSNDEAIKHYSLTGEHLGIFDTPAHATAFAQSLHNEQAQEYAPPPPPGFTPDEQPTEVNRPEATDAPIIISAIRPHPLKAEEVNPGYTVRAFGDENAGDPQYHTQLSEADKKEYAAFFRDPKNPPSAAALGLWYHQKTGAFLANAQGIVDYFKSKGKFSTAERITVPAKHQGSVAAGLDHYANALGLDYGSEIAAPFDALGLSPGDHPTVWNSDESFANLLANNADMEHAQLQQDSADHPVASITGELAGVATGAPLLGAVGDALGAGKIAQTAGQGTRAAVQGAAEGAAYGSGAAGPGDRLQGAALGAVAVPAVGAVAKLPFAAAEAGKTVLQGSPGLARRIVAKAIKADENTPAEVGADMSAAHANGVPMMLADTGENARGLLAAAGRTSGPARTIARDALEARQTGLAERVTNTIERDLGPVANPHKVADELMTKARTDAGPLYDAAYVKPGVQTFADKIKPLLQRPSMRKALSNAYRIAAEEGVDPETLGLSKFKPSDSPILDATGKPMQVDEIQVTKVPTWKTFDYIKRGMDDVVESYRDPVTGKLNLDTEGRATNNTLRSFLGAFDAANPEYAAARNAYAGPIKGIGAMNLGRKALNMTADDLEARMRDMSPFEKQMFALGTRRAMAELISSKGDSANVINAITGTGKKRAMLARLFGDRPTFNRFTQTLNQEKEGFRTYARALSGSSTALNLEDDATLKFASLAADMAANGGIPIATALRQALKFGIGKIGDKTKQQVAALLSETDPARFRELAAQLRAETVRRGLFKRKVGVVTNAGGKAVVATQAQ
jgi:hypothetical protein